MNNSKNYVGLYPNCTEVPTLTADYRIFSFYDKIIVLSYIPIHFHKCTIPFVYSNDKFNYFAIELDKDVASSLNFDDAMNETDTIIRGIIDDVITSLIENNIAVTENHTIQTATHNTILDNDRYEHYFMRYLKIRTSEYIIKPEWIQFFKLNDDYIELLETE